MKIQIWSLAQVPLNDLTTIQLLKHMEKTNVEWLLKTIPNFHYSQKLNTWLLNNHDLKKIKYLILIHHHGCNFLRIKSIFTNTLVFSQDPMDP
jgi:endonuclease/exonuclease/phosphatase (EEP) superfamily protein YafD